MSVPKEIVGDNKERDYEIAQLYCEGLMPMEIIDKMELTISERRVHQIIREQQKYISARIGWDKSKRLHALQKMAREAGFRLSKKKDLLNILEQMRKELEGDGLLIDQSQHYHYDITWKKDDSNRLQSSFPSGEGSRQPEAV